MAIKHIEIQSPDGELVTQSSVDELYIAMDNLDETSKVEGNVVIGNYTPSVVNTVQEKFGVTITPKPSAKKCLEIDPKHREVQEQFAKYSDDGSGHVTEEAAAQVTSVVIDPNASDVWDFDGLGEGSWFDKFAKVTDLPVFSNSTNVKYFKYTGGKKGTTLYGIFNRSKIENIILCANLSSNSGQFSNNTDLKSVVLDGSRIKTMNYYFDGDTGLEFFSLKGLEGNCSLYSYTFRSCNSIKNLDLSEVPSIGVTSMSGTFQSCRNLLQLNLSNFNLSYTCDITTCFNSCVSLGLIKAFNCDNTTVSLFKAALNNANLINTDLQHDPLTFTDDELAIKYSDLADHPNLEQIKKLGVGEQGISKIIAEKTTTFPTGLLAENDVWDFDGWYDAFSTSTSIPNFRENSNVTKVSITEGNKTIGDNYLNYSQITDLRFKGRIVLGNRFIYESYNTKYEKINLKGSTIIQSSYTYSGISCRTTLKINLSQIDFSFVDDEDSHLHEKKRIISLRLCRYFYSQETSLATLVKLANGGVYNYPTNNPKLIIGYLSTDKVGEDGTNWTYDSFDEETPDESLMACYDQNLYDYMARVYGETDALARVPSKEDYLNSR